MDLESLHMKFALDCLLIMIRPQSNYAISQLILDVIQQCWDADPLQRPKAEELYDLFYDLYDKSYKDYDKYEENLTINKQIEEADGINEKLPSSTATSGILSYTTHPQAIYTSKLLDFKNLPEPKNAEPEYSGN